MTHGVPEISALLILGIPAVINAVVADAPMPEWIGNASQVSAFGLVAWIVYFTLSKWLPDLQTKHSEHLKDMQAQHSEQMKNQREAHVAMMQQVTNTYSETLKDQREAFSQSLNTQRGDLLIAFKINKKQPNEPED